MSDVVYGAGALVAAERDDKRMWSLHGRLLARGAVPFVPAPVLTEVWRGTAGQHRLGLLLRSCTIDDLDGTRSRRAGVLLARAPHGVADASVVECALRRRAACISSNREHLLALAAPEHLEIIDV